ncbi:unnamed protein product [Symbiodinium sp. CCMP2592]|nr:unnamed protein product [Symbiodinium sp. CCMP2592]
MERHSPAEPPRGSEPARDRDPDRGRSKGKTPTKGKGSSPAKGKGSTRPKGKDQKGSNPGGGKSHSQNPAAHSKGGTGTPEKEGGKKHRSKSSREYSQRRAGKKQRAAGQYYRWSRPLPAEPAQHHDTPPPPPAPGRGGRKEADDESAASYSYYSSSRSRSPRGRNKEQGRGNKAKPVKAPARSSGKMAVKSKAKPPPEAEEKDSPASAEGDQESPAGSVAAKEESSDSCYEPIRLRPAPLSSPLRRALPVPDLGVSMQFTIQLKDASKEACSGRYLHAASLVYFARERSQEAERDLFKVTGPWTPRHTRALGVHRVVEEGKGGTSFFASLLETELVDPLPMGNPPLIFQISLTVCQAAKFANIRDLGRKNMGSRSMPQGMGDPPRYEVLLLDANDWEEYGSQTTPHWPNKRRAQGFWSTVGSFAPDLLDPLFALVKQNQADLQALTQGIYNLMGRTLNKGEMDDVLEALVSTPTQALGISPEGHICQYVLKQGGPHPLVPGQTWELHPLEIFQQGKLRKDLVSQSGLGMAKGKGKQWGKAYHVCKGKDCHNWRWGREEGNSRHFLRLLHSKWAELGDATKEAFQAAGFKPRPQPPQETSLLDKLRSRKGELPEDIQLLLDSLEEAPSATPYQEGQHSSNALTKASHRYRQLARKKLDLQASVNQAKEDLKAMLDELQEVDKLMEEAKQAIDDAQSKLTEALEQSDPTQASPPPIGEVASFQDFGKALGIEFTKEQQAVLDKAVAAHLPPGLTARTSPVFDFKPRLSQPQGKPEQDQRTGVEDLDSTKEAPDASMKEPPEGELEENSNPRDRSPRRTSRNGSKEANNGQE